MRPLRRLNLGRLAFAPMLCGLSLVGVPAQAQAQQPPALDLSPGAPRAECGKSKDDEIVVCGDRDRSRFRIDPTTLDAMRTADALKHPERVASREPPPRDCGVGDDICGGDAFPLLPAAIKVVTAIVDAVQGDDWRDPFRTGPDDYELYEQSKAKHSHVTIGVSAGNSGPPR